MTVETKEVDNVVTNTAALLAKRDAPYPLPKADFRPSQAIKQNRMLLPLPEGIARSLM
jgi:hypothetical protein